MQGRVLFVVLVFLATGLTGCLKGADNGPKVDQQSTNHTGLASNETIAPDGRGSISAFNETNKTEKTGIGSMMHTHDYWKGTTRQVIWTTNAGLIPGPIFPCKNPNCDFTQSGNTYPPGTAIADFDIPPPPKGGLVYEGTDHLEILFKDVHVEGTGTGGTPHVDHPSVHIGIDYITANDEPGHFHAGPEITPGTPAIIPVKPLDSDMPHQTKSLWVFRIYSKEANSFAFNLTVTAVKGNAVVNWPPHPNLYADKADRVIFDGEQKIASKGTAEANLDGADAGWQFPERVISWGSDSIDITISNYKFTSQVPVAPAKFILEYHNASYISKLGNGDQAGGRVIDSGSDGKTYHFHIVVDPQSYDTPYGQKSRWGFRFLPRYEDSGTTCPTGDDAAGNGAFLQEFLVGCQYFPWEETYHIQIVAHGHSIETGFKDLMDPNSGASTNSTAV